MRVRRKAEAPASPCGECDGRCCGRFVVCPTLGDIARLGRATGMRPEEFLELAPAAGAKFSSEQVIFLGDGGDGFGEYLLCLKRRPGGACVFQTTSGKCGAREAAPLVCKAYPFALRSGVLKYVDRFACRRRWDENERALGGFKEVLARLGGELEETGVVFRRWNSELVGGGRRGSFWGFVASELRNRG